MMLITKKVIEVCKQAIEYFENNENKSHYIVMRDDQKYLDHMVEKGNWYYGENSFVLWDGGSFGFTFDKSILELFEKENKK